MALSRHGRSWWGRRSRTPEQDAEPPESGTSVPAPRPAADAGTDAPAGLYAVDGEEAGYGAHAREGYRPEAGDGAGEPEFVHAAAVRGGGLSRFGLGSDDDYAFDSGIATTDGGLGDPDASGSDDLSYGGYLEEVLGHDEDPAQAEEFAGDAEPVLRARLGAPRPAEPAEPAAGPEPEPEFEPRPAASTEDAFDEEFPAEDDQPEDDQPEDEQVEADPDEDCEDANPRLPESRRALLAERATEEAEDAEQRLEELLAIAAEPPPATDFDALRRRYEPRPLPPEPEPGTPPAWEDFVPPEPPGSAPEDGAAPDDEPASDADAAPSASASASPDTRTADLRTRAEARLAHQRALREFREREAEIAEAAAAARAEHLRAEKARERAIADYNARLDEYRRAYEDAQPDAVESVLERALAAATGRLTELPGAAGLPGNGSARVHYRALTRTAVVDLALPAPGVVPPALSFRPTPDGIEGVPRPPAETRARYEQLVARLVLRALYALLAADTGGILYGVVLNGRAGSPEPEVPCLLSVDARYEELIADTLLPASHPEAVERLRSLTGAYSPDLPAQKAVTPLARPTPPSALAPTPQELSPGEFAGLAAELFEKLGVSGWTPKLVGKDGLLALADDRVVCVARWPEVVGAEAVRSALDVAAEEGREHCVWVSTGTFHPEALALAAERPGVRLIDGRELRTLIRRELGPELGG